MDDPVAAVASLRETTDVDVIHGTTELSADEWPDETVDQVWVGGIVLSPSADRAVFVRNDWSGEQWVVPGGGIEPTDSSLRAALRREVREETGLSVAVEEPLVVEGQTFVHVDDSYEERFVLFRAVADGTRIGDDPGEDGDEIEAVRWFDHAPETLYNHADRVRSSLE